MTILPYRVLNSDSTGLASDVAAAITAATDAGVHVINLSLGMEHRNTVVGEAILYARNNGVEAFRAFTVDVTAGMFPQRSHEIRMEEPALEKFLSLASAI